METDSELLSRYVAEGSNAAFDELARRYLDLVHSAAMRQANGDVHRAKEITQSVFTDLARKAPRLTRHPTLVGWLYTSTYFAATMLRRAEMRRRNFEAEAQTMNTILGQQEPAVDWNQIRPLIDGAMHALSGRERDAVLLRYFEKRPLADVGGQLGLSENAARKSVARGLEKLRQALARAGVTSSSGALAFALAEQAVEAAPVGLLNGVSAAATASGAGMAATGILAFKNLTKIGGAAALILVGATAVLLYERSLGRAPHPYPNPVSSTVSIPRQAGAIDVPTKAGAVPVSIPATAPIAQVTPPIAQVTTPAPPPWRATESLQNVGKATPEAALETLAAAMAHSDVAGMAGVLALGPKSQHKAAQALAQVPESERQQYGPLENVGATAILGSATRDELEFTAIRALSREQVDDSTVQLEVQFQNADGKATVRPMVFKQTEDGWRFWFEK